MSANDPLSLLEKGNSYCYNKKTKKGLDYTCLKKDTILQLVNIYNTTFCENNQDFCLENKIIHIKNRNIKEIYNELKTKLSKYNKLYNVEQYWQKINEFSKIFINNNYFHITKMPTEWCETIRDWRSDTIDAPWLSNYDIDDVIIKYEYKYPKFKFLGSTPIDFRKTKMGSCVLNIFTPDSKKSKWLKYKKNSDYCDFNPIAYSGKNIYGIVFNTDIHTGGGRHWMALYINVEKSIILFFDSAVTYKHLHPEIKSFIDNIKEQYPNKNFTFKYNTIQHQQSNSECGMYSIYFILTMLDADQNNFSSLKAFDIYFNNSGKTVTDKLMVLYRTKLFR